MLVFTALCDEHTDDPSQLYKYLAFLLFLQALSCGKKKIKLTIKLLFQTIGLAFYNLSQDSTSSGRIG